MSSCFFRKDIIHLIQVFFRFLLKRNTEDRPEFLFILFIIIATFITGALGIILEGAVGDGIKTPFVIAGSLTLTGIFLILIERFHRIGTRTEKEMTILDSIVVGLAQTLAVLPGIFTFRFLLSLQGYTLD
ncbi:undecaprenyl-diphosphate phosphatase [Sinobaca sp. H24]|uniref:undecaprenyl-diphosphate phosphatase n=1 Tax=Sinobaca sp. H24 TaxID=2923376 RepID=UPI002111B191|nr:undecaprenyl-diphosphate phosphatase [Sinobaca sp. H24]